MGDAGGETPRAGCAEGCIVVDSDAHTDEESGAFDDATQACANWCPATWSNEKKRSFLFFFVFPPFSPRFPVFFGVVLVFFDCFCACAIFSGIC